MDLEEKFRVKVPEVQSLSSSVHSTPEKNGHSDDASRSLEFYQEFLKSDSKRELLRACFSTQKKSSDSFGSKMVEKLKKSNKVVKNQATKGSLGANAQLSCKKPSNKKQNRKANNPKQVQPQDSKTPDNPLICRNSACRKVQPEGDKFCKRCTCCICLEFDDNKDPSKWLECKYQSGGSERNECGLSCHVECALANQEVGVVYHGPSMQLDGGYRCPSCGTVSGIVDFWKKQLVIAKHSRRLDTLSYKINLSCRLLDGTFKFKELHEIVKDAKAKLESEIGPTDMESAGMLHGLVGRLSVIEDVRNLCSLAIEKADELLAHSSGANPVTRARACSFVCDEVTLSSVQITVLGLFPAVPSDLKGYKLWHHKTREQLRPEEPTHVIPTTLKRVTITDLQPSTEYTFCVAAYSEAGDWGHSETNCVTKGVELVEINQSHMDLETETLSSKDQNNPTGIGSSEHRIRGLGALLCFAGADKLGSSSKGLHRAADMEERAEERPDNLGGHNLLSGHLGLDLNLMTVPDLNEEVVPPYDFSKDGEENMNAMVSFNGNGENIRRSNNQGLQIPAGNGTTTDFVRNTGNLKEDTHESNSTLSNKRLRSTPPRRNRTGGIDKSFKYCITTFRQLELKGHISQEFRMKLITWFCRTATLYERHLLRLLIDSFNEEPNLLGGQLFDSFGDRVYAERP